MDLGTYQMKINRRQLFYHVSHMLKNGHQISLHLQGVSVSVSHLQILLAGIFGLGMGIAGLMISRKGNALRLYHTLPLALETVDCSESLCFVAGLRNLGNNCFLNVILQGLASCSSFYPFLQSIIDVDRGTENFPLATALASLLKELCFLQDKRILLDPRKVMLAMSNYVASFSLTRQQDAAEALTHLLSSMQEELSDCYVPYHGSLADIYTLPFSRISNSERESETELKRWQQCFLGPFDGTLGSILTCRTCSLQLSLDFQLFNCLPLSPVMNRSASTVDGCTLEDCLKQFTAIERVHNYTCKHCWHVVAEKLLSFDAEKNKENTQKVKDCANHDSCDCKNIFPEGLPCSIDFSCTLKRLNICRCPKILCIHLQRASMTSFGELIKLQGHVSFPLELDIFPFTTAAMGMRIEILKKDKQMKEKQPHMLVPHQDGSDMLTFPFMHRLVAKPTGRGDDMDPSIDDSSGDCLHIDSFENNSCPEIETGVSDMPCANFQIGQKWGIRQHHYEKFGNSSHLFQQKRIIYRLVSVVEHYGDVGSGHYAVYRRGMAKPDANVSKFNIIGDPWFYASDAEVVNVSEEAVLAAEASMLFYERIDLST